EPVQLGERDLALAAGHHLGLRHAGGRAALRIAGPPLRQEQPQPHRHRHLLAGQGQRDQRLAAGLLAELPAVLPRHADGQRALLRQRRVVDHQRRARSAHQPVRLARQRPPQRRVVPGRAGDEVLQLVVPGQTQAGRHGLQALALARAEQAPQV
ncbi:MAG: hypothetical protein AVDCRST_MAG40-290, partial [uncultured Gemmatimonadaceae bacterium]